MVTVCFLTFPSKSSYQNPISRDLNLIDKIILLEKNRLEFIRVLSETKQMEPDLKPTTYIYGVSPVSNKTKSRSPSKKNSLHVHERPVDAVPRLTPVSALA